MEIVKQSRKCNQEHQFKSLNNSKSENIDIQFDKSECIESFSISGVAQITVTSSLEPAIEIEASDGNRVRKSPPKDGNTF